MKISTVSFVAIFVCTTECLPASVHRSRRGDTQFLWTEGEDAMPCMILRKLCLARHVLIEASTRVSMPKFLLSLKLAHSVSALAL